MSNMRREWQRRLSYFCRHLTMLLTFSSNKNPQSTYINPPAPWWTWALRSYLHRLQGRMRPGPRIPYCGLKGSIWEPSSPRNAQGLTLPFVEEVSISRMSLGFLSKKHCFHSGENIWTVPHTWCSDCNDKPTFRFLKTCNPNICFIIIQGVGKNLLSLILNKKQFD